METNKLIIELRDNLLGKAKETKVVTSAFYIIVLFIYLTREYMFSYELLMISVGIGIIAIGLLVQQMTYDIYQEINKEKENEGDII